VLLALLTRCTVIDAAEIVNVTSVLLVSDGDTAVLKCQVRANPLSVDRLITWSRPGYDMSRVVIEAPSVDKSLLTVAAVGRRDAGAFQCNAFNGVGVVSSATAQLVVKCKHPLCIVFNHHIIIIIIIIVVTSSSLSSIVSCS